MNATLSPLEFGAQLIRSEDLDPVYSGLVRAGLGLETLQRICLAYWCLYHLGAACKIAEAKSVPAYWKLLREAAHNDNPKLRWPRGAERRHWRGRQAIASAEELIWRYNTPSQAVEYMTGGGTYNAIAKRVQEHRGFGPWIAFKIADMADRVFRLPVDFSDCHLGIYKDPRQGAALLHTGDWRKPITDEELSNVVQEYIKRFRKFQAPPHRDRAINVQEVESVFCKYKSYHKGHYHPGKDIVEVRHGLAGWGGLAQQVLNAMPEEL